MDIYVEMNNLTADELIDLRTKVGWNGNLYQITESLKRSLCTIKIICDNQTVGVGRLVGDGIMYWYIQDVIVLPHYQKQGIGKKIIEGLMHHISENSLTGTTVTIGLMAAKGKEEFYSKFGFRRRPNENEGAGMIKQYTV